MTKTELAQKIKKKYPQYADIEDILLADKIIDEYPTYKSKITEAAQIKQKGEAPFKKFREQDIKSYQNVIAQTAAGEAIGVEPTSFAGSIVGAPERVPRIFGAVGREAASAAELGGEYIFKGIDELSGNRVSKVIGKSIKNIGGTKAGRKVFKTIADIGNAYAQYKEDLPEYARANIEAAEGIAMGGSVLLGAPFLKSAAKTFVKKLPSKVNKINKSLDEGIMGGIKPTSDKKTLSRYKSYQGFINDLKKGVISIAKYKDKVNLIDDITGEQIKNPTNLFQMADALKQTKQQIYKEFTDISKKAGKEGFRFDMSKINTKLDEIASGAGKEKFTPAGRMHIEKLKDDLTELQGMPPEIIESRIRDLNENLVSFYAGRADKEISRLEGSVAKLMRNELDEQITKALGEKTEYKKLRTAYADLKKLEPQVQHRVKVDARKATKGLADMSDIFTGGDLLSGVITMNPGLIAKGLTGRAIKEFYKKLNDPNSKIKKMFRALYGPDVLKKEQKKFLKTKPIPDVQTTEYIKKYLRR